MMRLGMEEDQRRPDYCEFHSSPEYYISDE